MLPWEERGRRACASHDLRMPLLETKRHAVSAVPDGTVGVNPTKSNSRRITESPYIECLDEIALECLAEVSLAGGGGQQHRDDREVYMRCHAGGMSSEVLMAGSANHR